MRNFAYIILFLALRAHVCGQAAVSVDRQALRIGDHIVATLSVNVPEGYTWLNREAVWPDSMTSFAVVAKPSFVPAVSPIRDQYTLAVFDTGDIALPALPILLGGPGGVDTLVTEPVHLGVASVEPDSSGLIPIRDIYREPFRPAYYLRYIPHLLGLLFVIALIGYWLRRRKRPEAVAEPFAPYISPETWAFGQLDDLTAARLWQRGEVKAHYTRLTDIFREYLERRFRIRAKEQTTREITAQLSRIDLRQDAVADAAELLQVADFVKFAKADPGMDIHQHAIERIRQFIRDARVPDQEVDNREGHA